MEQEPQAKRPRLSTERSAMQETPDPRKLPMPRVPRGWAHINESGNEVFYERTCYDEYYQLIKTQVLEKKARPVAVAGTFGIGNTTFYAYCVDRFRREHPEVWVVAASLWRSKLRVLDVYKGDGTEPQRHWHKEDEAIWDAQNGAIAAGRDLVMFCDGSPDTYRYGIQTVVFTEADDDDWICVVRKFDATFYAPLWTREELKEAARVLDLWISKKRRYAGSTQSDCERDAEIDARFEVFGGVAFYCLHEDAARIVTGTRLLHEEIMRMHEPRELYTLLAGKLERLRETQSFLVHIDVSEDSKKVGVPCVASRDVQKMLADFVLAHSPLHRSVLQEQIRRLPHASSFSELLEKRRVD